MGTTFHRLLDKLELDSWFSEASHPQIHISILIIWMFFFFFFTAAIYVIKTTSRMLGRYVINAYRSAAYTFQEEAAKQMVHF